MPRLALTLLGQLILSSALTAADKVPMAISIWAIDADGSNVRELGAIPGYPIINSPEVSPDGTWVAVDGWKHGEKNTAGHVLLLNVETKETRDLGPGCMPSWSADGEWLGISKYAPGGVYMRQVDSDVETCMDPTGWAIQLSSDGTKAAYVRHSSKLVVDDFASNTQREYIPDQEDPYRYIMHNCRWSPDSSRICFIGVRQSGKREVAILSIDPQNPDLTVVCDADNIDPDIAWHPHDDRITFPSQPKASQPGQIMVVNARQPADPLPFPGQPPDRSNRGMCWTADGQTLIFVSNAASPWR
ncbi:MAG: PD40 domain-containing protein [Planctomycetaceae bacterium]|nr:PD40 domain-containing protein [Planctomycetaceae bacterium]